MFNTTPKWVMTIMEMTLEFIFKYLILFSTLSLGCLIIYYLFQFKKTSFTLSENSLSLINFEKIILKKINKSFFKIIFGIFITVFGILYFLTRLKFPMINLTFIGFFLGILSFEWIKPFVFKMSQHIFKKVLNKHITDEKATTLLRHHISIILISSILFELIILTLVYHNNLSIIAFDQHPIDLSTTYMPKLELYSNLLGYITFVSFYLIGYIVKNLIYKIFLEIFNKSASLSQQLFNSTKLHLPNNDLRDSSVMLHNAGHTLSFMKKYLSIKSTLLFVLFFTNIAGIFIEYYKNPTNLDITTLSVGFLVVGTLLLAVWINFILSIILFKKNQHFLPQNIIITLSLLGLFYMFYLKNWIHFSDIITVLLGVIAILSIFNVFKYCFKKWEPFIIKKYQEGLLSLFLFSFNKALLLFLYLIIITFVTSKIIFIVGDKDYLLTNGIPNYYTHLLFYIGFLSVLPNIISAITLNHITNKVQTHTQILNENLELNSNKQETIKNNDIHILLKNILKSTFLILIIPFYIFYYAQIIGYFLIESVKSIPNYTLSSPFFLTNYPNTAPNAIIQELHQKIDTHLFSFFQIKEIDSFIVIGFMLAFIFLLIIIAILFHTITSTSEQISSNTANQIHQNPDILKGQALPNYIGFFKKTTTPLALSSILLLIITSLLIPLLTYALKIHGIILWMILILIITFTLTTISSILTTFWSYAKHHHEHTETNIKPNFLNNISLLFSELINPILISLCFLCLLYTTFTSIISYIQL